MNPFGVAFSLINKSDLILVNHSGQVIDGGECRLLNTAAYMIHSAIHAARPDVNCAAHSHSIYGRTFCSLGRKLDTLTQDACAFHNDHVVYDSFNGVVLAEKEGKDIAKCLGDKKAALLQNHGLLTVGATIEEVSYLATTALSSSRAFTDFFFLFFFFSPDHLLVRLAREVLPLPAHGRGCCIPSRRKANSRRRRRGAIHLSHRRHSTSGLVWCKAHV